MANVLFIKNESFGEIAEFISELCRNSGVIGDKINIEELSRRQNTLPYQILVLSQPSKQKEIYRALDLAMPESTLIVNADEKFMPTFKLSKPVRFITYGFNSKATVTASSVSQQSVMKIQCCIQRSFLTLGGVMLEPQEFTLCSNELSSLTVHNMLISAIVAALCGGMVDRFKIIKNT